MKMIQGPYEYKPIQKDLKDWTPDDLEILRDTSEGWYLDYKQDLISAKDIAKQMSAFANQYGGFLFFGVKEGDERKAGSYPGIEKYDVSKLLDRVRDVATQNVQPCVTFDQKVFNGPNETIGLPSARSIVVIGIPRGLSPPYITSGKVYRRIEDKSTPEAETNHHIIHELWKKREESRKRLDRFLSQIPSMSSQQEGTVWAHVFLITDPFFDDYCDLNFIDFVTGMKKSQNNEIHDMDMDNFFATKDGYIARHVFDNDPSNSLLNFRWWRNGNARISIPIVTV